MSRGGQSTLREHAFAVQRLLYVGPDLWAGFAHGQQEFGLLRNIAQIAYQFGAGRAGPQMLFFSFVPAALNDVRQYFLKLLAIHG
jgi:hypothetical protein